jgi:hypothetical protein
VPQDHWFAAQAVTDLDDDGVVLTFELTSVSKNVWIGVNGNDWPQGWD